MRSLPSSSQAAPTWNYAWLGGGAPASPSTSTVPAVPDCTGKALESARVISPEIGGWAPGCPLSSSYQPYSVTQTHHSGAKFDLLHKVLRGSPRSVVECEASSWPVDPPRISASFPTSPVPFPHSPTSPRFSARLSAPLLSLLFWSPGLTKLNLTSWLLLPPACLWSWPRGTAASPCGRTWHCTSPKWPISSSLNLEQLRCIGAVAESLGLQRPPPPAPNPRSSTALQTLNMNEQWEKEASAAVGGN